MNKKLRKKSHAEGGIAPPAPPTADTNLRKGGIRFEEKHEKRKGRAIGGAAKTRKGYPFT